MTEDNAPTDAARGLGIMFILSSFAFNSLATRWTVADDRLDAGLTTAVRFLTGAATLVIIALATGRHRTLMPDGRGWHAALWLALYAFLISYGYRFIGAAAGTFVFFAAVLVTMASAQAIRTRAIPPARSLIGALLALVGLGVLASGDIETVTVTGLALMLGTGIAWGTYSVLGTRAGDPITRTVRPFVAFGLVLIAPTAWAFASGDVRPVTGPGLAMAAFMGAVPTGIAYAFWAWTLPHLTGTQAGVYQMLVPVLTAIGAIVWLGESFDVLLVVAGALVIAGMGLTTPKRPPTTDHV